MRVWLITLGEPLPMDSPNERLLRTGMLANLLAGRGHTVVWWTSTFDHVRKRQRCERNQAIAINERYRIQMLHGTGYRRNMSLARVINHRQVAEQFDKLAHAEEKPDVMLCSLPTIELCVKATNFGTAEDVPVVIDVRDLWPDVYLESVPAVLRPLIWPFFYQQRRVTRQSCAQGTAICGITDPFVTWGLGYAGRDRRPADRTFHMGYSRAQPTPELQETARLFWEQRGMVKASFILCFFGNVGSFIDLDPVIEAAQLLQGDAGCVRFVICGSGPQYEHYRTRAEHLEAITFPGWVGRAEILELMRVSSFGLVPYRNVSNYRLNLPNKPIEYLAGGLPVMSALQSGVLKELIDRTGCGDVYTDGRSLASLCQRYAHHRAAHANLANNARALYEDCFVAEQIYEAMADYLEVMGCVD